MEARKIEVEGKVNKKHVKKLIEKDREMINKALEVEGNVIGDLTRAMLAIEAFVGFGLLTVDEAVEVSLGIKKALAVFEKRNTAATVARIADLGAARVAEMIGGEVVEGGE